MYWCLLKKKVFDKFGSANQIDWMSMIFILQQLFLLTGLKKLQKKQYLYQQAILIKELLTSSTQTKPSIVIINVFIKLFNLPWWLNRKKLYVTSAKRLTQNSFLFPVIKIKVFVEKSILILILILKIIIQNENC